MTKKLQPSFEFEPNDLFQEENAVPSLKQMCTLVFYVSSTAIMPLNMVYWL